MIGEQAPLGRKNQKSKQNEFQTIKPAFSGAHSVLGLRTIIGGMAVGGGGGSFWREVRRPWGELCTIEYTDGQVGPHLLALHTCVMDHSPSGSRNGGNFNGSIL